MEISKKIYFEHALSENYVPEKDFDNIEEMISFLRENYESKNRQTFLIGNFSFCCERSSREEKIRLYTCKYSHPEYMSHTYCAVCGNVLLKVEYDPSKTNTKQFCVRCEQIIHDTESYWIEVNDELVKYQEKQFYLKEILKTYIRVFNSDYSVESDIKEYWEFLSKNIKIKKTGEENE